MNNLANEQELEALKETFKQTTLDHRARVNKYAKKINEFYPNHDQSKLDFLLDGYCYYCKKDEELTDEEDDLLNAATYIHIKNSPHHPEYWTDCNLKGFTRKNYTPNGPIDATQMPQEALTEMVCDWCAVSEVNDNTPYEWFNKVNGRRWIFNKQQQDFILDVMDAVWE